MRAIAIAFATAAVAAGVLLLRAETMSTHVEAPPGSRTEVIVRVDTRNAESSATERELTYALVLACRLHVNAELRSSGLREVGPDTYGFTLSPALDESDQRQLHGCLEDTRIDHVQLAVARLENMVRSGNGRPAALPLGGESTRRSHQFAR